MSSTAFIGGLPPRGVAIARARGLAWLRRGLMVLLLLALWGAAHAHDPFDGPTVAHRAGLSLPIDLEALQAPVPAAGFQGFFTLGLWHVLTGIDHLLFLAALLLGTRSLRSVVTVVAAFTLAQSVTLALSAWDVVRMPPTLVEPMIALSIVAVCVENIFRHAGDKRRHGLTMGFGLIHGLAFADTFKASVGPGVDPGLPMVAFNLGIGSGQLLAAIPTLLVLMTLRRHHATDPRATTWLSARVAAVTAIWVVGRIWP